MTDNLKSNTTQFLFSLKRLRPDCKVLPTIVDFSPPFMNCESCRSMVPTFNRDACHYTPSFILSIDQKMHQKQRQSQRREFEGRIHESLSSEIQKIEGQKWPSSHYCQICQEVFQNYDEHLERKDHQKRCHHNEFNEDIRALCQLVKQQAEEGVRLPKKKLIKKGFRNGEASGLVYSPKTTVYNNSSKRKMSMSSTSFNLEEVSQK